MNDRRSPREQLMADLKKVGDIMLADWLKKAGADGQAGRSTPIREACSQRRGS